MNFEFGLNSLESAYLRVLEATPPKFKRYLYDEIDFNARLIIIKGARGVGKTTLLLQHLKAGNRAGSIYLSLDHLIFSTYSLLEVVEVLYESNRRVFALDEVHRYPNWSAEIKNIYDSYPDVKLLVTSSSALNIMQGMADLSRRADVYELSGLSFREYLMLDAGLEHKAISFKELVDSHEELAENLYHDWDISRKFNAYKKKGYYPYYKEAGRKYPDRLRETINQVIEIDLPAIFNIDYETTRQVKKLLAMIARVVPFTPNIAKLSRDLSIHRNRILIYLDYLEGAKLIHILKSNSKSDSVMTKPDKIFLENSNLSSVLSDDDDNIGTVRETFCMNALSVKNKVSTPVKGDFMVDNKWILEVGGPNKSIKQISDMPNPLIIRDKIEKGGRGIIPLWTLGFLY